MISPDEDDRWAEAIDTIARDDAQRAAVIAQGDAHQEQFRWDRVAADTEQVYAEVLGHP